MTITAKYPSTCQACSCPITVGQQIEWTKGSPARHTACGATAGTTVTAAPQSTGRIITVERVGRRSYLRGDTLAVRGLLRAGGCHWDAEARAWWIGSQDAARALAISASTAPTEAAPPRRITHCVNGSCGCELDAYQQARGYRTCSTECSTELRMGSGWSGVVNGAWHQGSDD